MLEEFGSELDGKVTIVTGASSGIGGVTARSLASRGVSVVVAARRGGEPEELTATTEDDGGGALVVLTGITVDDDIDALVEATLDEYGRIDILVNNAGLMPPAHIGGVDREALQTTINVSPTGTITLTYAVAPTMMEQESGHIINLSSVVGRLLQVNSPHYNAMKAGVKIFSDSPRLDTAGAGIHVSSIEPGTVDTELFDYAPDEEVQKNVEDRVDMMNAPTSEGIARTIMFVVMQPERVDINEVLIRPPDQVQP